MLKVWYIWQKEYIHIFCNTTKTTSKAKIKVFEIYYSIFGSVSKKKLFQTLSLAFEHRFSKLHFFSNNFYLIWDLYKGPRDLCPLQLRVNFIMIGGPEFFTFSRDLFLFFIFSLSESISDRI